MSDDSKPTIDLLRATKAVVERDLKLGLVTEDQLRLTIQARKERAKELKANGASLSQIASDIGTSKAQAARDVASQNETKSSQNETTKADRRAQREIELAAKQRAMPTTRYGVIYADPPWRFEPYSRETGMDRAADNHYPTMDLDDIKTLDVPAADDCVLFLWATGPMLPEALEVMKSWGFTYKSRCVWYKTKLGTGYWFRDNAEELLVGVKGNIPAPVDTAYPAVISARQTKHSAKPFAFREIIEELFPNLPRIELFARERFEGWDAWGNEAQDELA